MLQILNWFINRDIRKNVNCFGGRCSSLNFRFHNGNLSRVHIRDANTIQFSKDRIRRARWRAPASRKADEHRRCRPRKPGKSVMQESLMTTNGAPCMQVNAQGPTSRRTSVEASSDLSATVIRDSIAETRTRRYDIGKTKNREYTIRKRRDRRRQIAVILTIDIVTRTLLK